MRLRTLIAITLTMFALPAVAAELPGALSPRQMPAPVPPDAPEPSVCYEVRILKVPAGFDCVGKAGVKLSGEVILTDAELRQVLVAAQTHPDTVVTNMPRITVADGEAARISNHERRFFVTGLDATKVNGAPVLVPKNTPIDLGDSVVITGNITGDRKGVRVSSHFTRVRIEGKVELLPVTTQITPVFEGGARGNKPIPFTQFLQVPDVRTEKFETGMTVPADGTFVLGAWKEADCPVFALATVRLPRTEPAVMAPPMAPPAEEKIRAYPLKRAAAQKVAQAILAGIEAKKLKARVTFDVSTNTVFVMANAEMQLSASELIAALDEVANNQQRQVYKLRNVGAEDAAKAITAHLESKNQKVKLVAEPVSNTILVSGEAAACERAFDLLAALDKEPQQVMIQAMVIQVPRGFAEECGLTADTANGAWTLSPREQQMFNGLLRAGKERGTLDVLARPQVCVKDGQAGFVQVGQQVPALTDTAVKQIEYVSTGMTLKVTPRVSPDGKSVLLDANYNHTELAPGLVSPGERATAPAFTTQQMDTQTDVRFGDALVFRASALNRSSFSGVLVRHCRGREEVETLVIMTPALVRSEPARPVRPLRWFR